MRAIFPKGKHLLAAVPRWPNRFGQFFAGIFCAPTKSACLSLFILVV